jgi:hypothetical protein
LAQSLEQLCRGLAVVVVAGPQERHQALLPERAGVLGAGIALQERKRDRAIEIVKQTDRAGPEPLKLSTQLIGHRHPRADEILSGPGQGPQRLGLIAVGFKDPEAMSIGPGQLTQHEPVKPIGLPARRAKPIARRLDLIGMQGQHPHP